MKAICEYGGRCRQESDQPSAPEPGAVLEGVPYVHGLDWPFVSELERARWKALCLRRARVKLSKTLKEVAKRLAKAAQAVRSELPTASGGSHVSAEAVAAVRAQLKGISTSLRLDGGASIEMVHEAVQLCAPVLCYVALGDC